MPLPTLLSHALVAYTIEVDNEFERHMPHRTSTGPQARSGRGPWLVSVAMWERLLRYLPRDGATPGELAAATGSTHLPLAGMTRWGYVTVDGDRVTATRAGLKADRVWTEVVPAVERRWRAHRGDPAVDALVHALQGVTGALDQDLPGVLPMSGHGLFAVVDRPRPRADATSRELITLLNQVLLAFTLEYEQDRRVALAMAANVLRLLDRDDDAPVRDLTTRAGISKEALDVSLGYLARGGLVTATTKETRLTERGAAAKDGYRRRLETVERAWAGRFDLPPLRAALEAVPVAMPEPYPGSWRAARRRVTTLPDHPMVLHRGGFPDGA